MGKRKLAKESGDSADSDYAPDDDYLEPRAGGSQKNNRKKNKSRHSSQVQAGQEAVEELSEALPPHAVSTHTITAASDIRIALLGWFAGVHDSRGMPWRKRYDPTLGREQRSQRAYEVWVSEIMLQQTQVVTVIPYYTRWMEGFPNIRELAAASVDEVNALWKGLGYYSRASRLLAGAQKAVKEYEGRLPDNAKDLEANIPGIGRYSAGAIASIAYGERAPVLDGNVHRLLSRLLALHAPPKSKTTLDLLWSAATDIVKPKAGGKTIPISVDEGSSMVETQYAGDINQALIELGSTVCKAYSTTSSPSVQTDIPDIEELCDLCEPLQVGAGVTSYPMKVDRKKQREELDIVNVVEWSSMDSPNDRFFLMLRRPEGGLLAGLYEFPTASNVSKSLTAVAQSKLPTQVLAKLLQSPVAIPTPARKARKSALEDSLFIESVKPAKDVLHIFSHIKKTYRPQWVILKGDTSPPSVLPGDAGPRWVPLDEVGNQKFVVPPIIRDYSANGGLLSIGTGTMKVWQAVSKLWADP